MVGRKLGMVINVKCSREYVSKMYRLKKKKKNLHMYCITTILTSLYTQSHDTDRSCVEDGGHTASYRLGSRRNLCQSS